jgi:O-antigen/teichoic acid export membrane protein
MEAPVLSQTQPQMSTPDVKTLTSNRVLARSTINSFLGQLIPLIVGFLSIRVLIEALGTDRFGVLTLAWLVVGYFSLFDLGLGRALTQLVAEKLGGEQESEIPALAWTTLLLMLMLGLVGGVILAVLSPWIVYSVLKIPPILQTETLQTFFLLAFSLPAVILSSSLTGILTALQRVDLINMVRIPMSIFSNVGPIFVLPFSHSLFPVVGVIVVGRYIALTANLLLCFKAFPPLAKEKSIEWVQVQPLLRFGGWMTITNVVGPLMVYLDRFLIGGVISASAVAYYATPYEVVTKLWIIPTAIVGVLFPAFATSYIDDPRRTASLYQRGLKYVFLIIFPIVLIIVALAHEGLDLWLKTTFADNSTRPLQWLAVGVFINSLAQTPFTLIQGIGRPDLTAKLHLVELPFYLLLLWFLLGAMGIEGAAIAWTARVLFDGVLLVIFAERLLPPDPARVRSMLQAMGIALFAFALAAISMPLVLKCLVVGGGLIAYAFMGWFRVLAEEERLVVLKQLKFLTPLT